MIIIKANLRPDMEAAIRRQAEQARMPINVYLAPILNAVAEGRLTVDLVWQEAGAAIKAQQTVAIQQ